MSNWRDDLKNPQEKEKEAKLIKQAEDEQAREAIKNVYIEAARILNEGAKLLKDSYPTVQTTGDKMILNTPKGSVAIDLSRDGMKISVEVNGVPDDEIIFSHKSKSLEGTKGPIMSVDSFIGSRIKKLAK